MAVIELKWTRDGCVMGFVADWGDVAAIDIWPHEKGGWSWCVITDDAEEEVPQGWDPTLEAAKKHSESAYLDWRDVIEGRKAVPDEHDETADLLLPRAIAWSTCAVSCAVRVFCFVPVPAQALCNLGSRRLTAFPQSEFCTALRKSHILQTLNGQSAQ